MSKQIIKGYEIVNDEKWNRAVEGSMGKEGKLENGVGEDASDELKLAAYDKLGGLIRKDGHKVKTGSFFDFEEQAPRGIPNVLLVFRDLEGNIIELPEAAEIPMEVRAAEKAKEHKPKRVKKVVNI